MISFYILVFGIIVCAVTLTNIPLLQKFQPGLVRDNAKKAFKKGNKIVLIGRGKKAKMVSSGIAAAGETGLIYSTDLINNYMSGDEIKAEKNNNLKRLLEQYDKLIKANRIKEALIVDDSVDYDALFSIIEKCKKNKIKVKISSDKVAILEKNLKTELYSGIPFISFKETESLYAIFGIKRVLDFLLAFVIIIILLPLMLIISLLIKTTSAGTVLFNQQRIGFNGKYFKMYKFRSMDQNCKSDENREKMMLEFMKCNKVTGPDSKIVDSKRITKVGKILRKTSLDELPQLFNVIKGEMSLVGPRPSIPFEYENYYKWQKLRVNVLPGCTGLWQVSGRSRVSFEDSILLDLYYANNITFMLDLKILFKTIPVMIFSRGGR